MRIYGQGGVYDPEVIEILDFHTTNFWFSLEEQNILGLLPGDPGAAQMCTAETLKPKCRMEELHDVHSLCLGEGLGFDFLPQSLCDEHVCMACCLCLHNFSNM